MVVDQIGAPTFSGHLALALKAAVENNLRGVHHAVGGGDCTWFDFAARIASLAGFGHAPQTAVTTAELGLPAPRPANSRLDTTGFAAATGYQMPAWQDGLHEHLRRLGRV